MNKSFIFFLFLNMLSSSLVKAVGEVAIKLQHPTTGHILYLIGDFHITTQAVEKQKEDLIAWAKKMEASVIVEDLTERAGSLSRQGDIKNFLSLKRRCDEEKIACANIEFRYFPDVSPECSQFINQIILGEFKNDRSNVSWIKQQLHCAQVYVRVCQESKNFNANDDLKNLLSEYNKKATEKNNGIISEKLMTRLTHQITSQFLDCRIVNTVLSYRADDYSRPIIVCAGTLHIHRIIPFFTEHEGYAIIKRFGCGWTGGVIGDMYNLSRCSRGQKKTIRKDILATYKKNSKIPLDLQKHPLKFLKRKFKSKEEVPAVDLSLFFQNIFDLPHRPDPSILRGRVAQYSFLRNTKSQFLTLSKTSTNMIIRKHPLNSLFITPNALDEDEPIDKEERYLISAHACY